MKRKYKLFKLLKFNVHNKNNFKESINYSNCYDSLVKHYDFLILNSYINSMFFLGAKAPLQPTSSEKWQKWQKMRVCMSVCIYYINSPPSHPLLAPMDDDRPCFDFERKKNLVVKEKYVLWDSWLGLNRRPSFRSWRRPWRSRYVLSLVQYRCMMDDWL